MVAYADATSLELYLQRELTAGESDAAAAACAAATDYIDREVGRSWQGTTVSGEVHEVEGTTVRLDRTPVASVVSATSRALVVGQAPTALVAGSDYELLDGANGLLLVNLARGSILTVTYAVGSPAPASILLAANIIAAAYLVSAPTASRTARGIQKLKAGSAEITYDPIEQAISIPVSARELLDAYKPAFGFA